MRPTTRRLFSVCVALFVASAVGLVFALLFQWPAQLTRTLEGGGLGDPTVGAAEGVTEGTVTSLPLFPWIALAAFALLARSRRWWGTIAVVALCLLGALFVFGGLGRRSRRPRRTCPARCSWRPGWCTASSVWP